MYKPKTDLEKIAKKLNEEFIKSYQNSQRRSTLLNPAGGKKNVQSTSKSRSKGNEKGRHK